jgi:hypothetical protein
MQEPLHDDFEKGHMIVDASGNFFQRLPSPHPSLVPDISNAYVLWIPSANFNILDAGLANEHDQEQVSDSNGYLLLIPASLSFKSGMEEHHTPHDESMMASTHSIYTMHSVFKVDGVSNKIDQHLLEDIPDQHKQGSVKAKVTWFGALCLAGISMFVEAFIIITSQGPNHLACTVP